MQVLILPEVSVFCNQTGKYFVRSFVQKLSQVNRNSLRQLDWVQTTKNQEPSPHLQVLTRTHSCTRTTHALHACNTHVRSRWNGHAVRSENGILSPLWMKRYRERVRERQRLCVWVCGCEPSAVPGRGGGAAADERGSAC